jgi:hypothetical protein
LPFVLLRFINIAVPSYPSTAKSRERDVTTVHTYLARVEFETLTSKVFR